MRSYSKCFFKVDLAGKGTAFEMKRWLMIHLCTDFTSEPIKKLVYITLFAKVI